MAEKSFQPQRQTAPPAQSRDESDAQAGLSAYLGNQALLGRELPLPEGVRSRMEEAFNADFSGVTITESPLVTLTGARAYTMGSQIFVPPGGLDLASPEGQALLGHELSHVASQARGQVAGSGFLHDQGLERQADTQGLEAARELPVSGIPASPAPGISRAAGPMQAKGKDRVSAMQSGSISKIMKNMSFLDWAKMLLNAGSYGRYAQKSPQGLHALDSAEYTGLDLFTKLEPESLTGKSKETAEQMKTLGKETAQQIHEDDAERSDLPESAKNSSEQVGDPTGGFTTDHSFDNPMPEHAQFRLGVYVKASHENYLKAQTTRSKYKLLGKKNAKYNAWMDTLKETAAYRAILEKKKARAALMGIAFVEQDDPDLSAYLSDNENVDPECGHTFLKFDVLNRDAGGSIARRYSFGFWPRTRISGPMHVTPGIVANPDPDTDQEQQHRDYDVSYPSYAKMATHVRAVAASNRAYSFTGYNCTAFAADVAQQGGISLPSSVRMSTLRQLAQKVDSPTALAINLGMFSQKTTKDNLEGRVKTYLCGLTAQPELMAKLTDSPFISGLSARYQTPLMTVVETIVNTLASRMTPDDEEAEGTIALNGKDPQFELDKILFNESNLTGTIDKLGLREALDQKLHVEGDVEEVRQSLSGNTRMLTALRISPGLQALNKLEGITLDGFLDRLSEQMNSIVVKKILKDAKDVPAAREAGAKSAQNELIITCLISALGSRRDSPVEYLQKVGLLEKVFPLLTSANAKDFIENNAEILQKAFEQNEGYREELSFSGSTKDDYYYSVQMGMQSRFRGPLGPWLSYLIGLFVDKDLMQNFLMNL